MKEVGKTTRPFKYDLKQILYDYTVEVTNRFKGLDMIDRVPAELWMEVCDIVQETGIKTIPMVKNSLAKQEAGLIPGSGRSLEEGNDSPLKYPCLEIPMDRGA